MTEGHRRRLHFVDSLASKLATPLDTFGVGIRNLPDKWDGLAPYKYSIAIENTSEPDYWTEKLSDALLSYCHVFYWGCPNIASYLPSQSMTWIDINDVDAAVATIEATIAANAFETSREAVAKARGLILDKYNLFPFSIDLFGKLPTPTRPRPITIRSKRVMEPISNRLMGRARGLVRDIGRLASR